MHFDHILVRLSPNRSIGVQSTWQVMKVNIENGGSFTVRYAFASQRGYYPDGKPPTPHSLGTLSALLARCASRMAWPFPGHFRPHETRRMPCPCWRRKAGLIPSIVWSLCRVISLLVVVYVVSPPTSRLNAMRCVVCVLGSDDMLSFPSPTNLTPVIPRAEPNKANQDSFIVVPDFCGDRMSLFCGVFDGHGGTGDLCSNFVAQRLPQVSASISGRWMNQVFNESFMVSSYEQKRPPAASLFEFFTSSMFRRGSCLDLSSPSPIDAGTNQSLGSMILDIFRFPSQPQYARPVRPYSARS